MIRSSLKWISASSGVSAACLLLVVVTALLPPYSLPARAQAPGIAGVGETETIAIRATVKAVDMKTRTVCQRRTEFGSSKFRVHSLRLRMLSDSNREHAMPARCERPYIGSDRNERSSWIVDLSPHSRFVP